MLAFYRVGEQGEGVLWVEILREAGTMMDWGCGFTAVVLCIGQYDVDIWKSVCRFQ